MSFVVVAEEEGDEPIELPCEEDGTLLLTTLTGQFPGACGLKYRNPESLAWRGVRLSDARLYCPHELAGAWGVQVYVTVMPKADKRKSDELLATENSVAKNKRLERSKCSGEPFNFIFLPVLTGFYWIVKSYSLPIQWGSEI